MADNSRLDQNTTTGDLIVTREISHGGDTAKLQGTFVMGVSGTEGAYTAAAINGDATNGLDVDVTRVNGTVTVDNGGTFAVQASQAGTWNITNISGTISLPTGAATAANQSTANGHLSNIVTSVQLLDNAIYVDDADWTDSTSSHMLVGGLYQSTPQTITDGDVGPLQVDSNGFLNVHIQASEISSSGGTSAADDADFTAGTTAGTPAMGVYESSPTSVTDGDLGTVGITQTRALKVHIASFESAQTDDAAFATTTDTVSVIGAVATPTDTSVDANDGGAVAMSLDRRLHVDADLHIAGTNITGGAGAVAAGTPRVTLASDDPAVALLGTIDTDTGSISTNMGTVAGAVSGTEMQVDVVAALPAGTNNIGDVDIASAIPAGTNMIGRIEQNVSVSATGTTTYYDADLDETAIAVDAGAVNIYSIQAFNTTDAPLFLQLFNVASGSVTVGTTTPTNQYVIPGNADSDGAGFTITFGVPKTYGTALTVACTTNSQGNGAPGAGACIVNIEYAT